MIDDLVDCFYVGLITIIIAIVVFFALPVLIPLTLLGYLIKKVV